MAKRYHWLEKVIKHRHYRIGAEVGVDRAETSSYLMQTCPELFLYCVDIWERPTLYWVDGKRKYHPVGYARDLFDYRMKPYEGRFKILLGCSWEIADEVEDNSLDFVFVDADHHYGCVIKDVRAWSSKLKAHGLMCGHDYQIECVAQAVQDLTRSHHLADVDNCWYFNKSDIVAKKLELVRNEQKYWEDIRKLRNNESTRFIQQEEITQKRQHDYMSIWNDSYKVCLSCGVFVGFIGCVEFDIRLAVVKNMQHKGIGEFMLRELIKINPTAMAKVKKDNTASKRLFEKCGFRLRGEDEWFYYFIQQ